MSSELSASSSPKLYSTTHSARVVILVGCVLALLGDFLPWVSSNAFTLDLTKTGITSPVVLMASFASGYLAMTSFVLLCRLTRPGAILLVGVALFQLLVIGAIRAQLEDPGLGLYLLPMGSALVCVGALMVMAYPARKVA